MAGMIAKISITYRHNLAPAYLDINIEDIELSMLDPAILVQIVTPAVILYDEPTTRAIVLKHAPLKSSPFPFPWQSLTGRLYSRLADAFNDVDDSYDPPAFQPLVPMPV